MRREVWQLSARLFLGGVFLLAAWLKLRDPQAFADSVMAFKMLPSHLAQLATFVIPWTEVLAGLGLVLGVWTRAAGLVIAAMLVVFIAGIISAMVRDLDLDCSCFGRAQFPCPGKVGACHLVRNVVLLALAGVVVRCGAGRLSLDERQG